MISAFLILKPFTNVELHQLTYNLPTAVWVQAILIKEDIEAALTAAASYILIYVVPEVRIFGSYN